MTSERMTGQVAEQEYMRVLNEARALEAERDEIREHLNFMYESAIRELHGVEAERDRLVQALAEEQGHHADTVSNALELAAALGEVYRSIHFGGNADMVLDEIEAIVTKALAPQPAPTDGEA